MDPFTAIVLLTPGTPEVGVWCGPCSLPSAVRVALYQLGETGVSLIATAEMCTECGAGGAA